MSGESDSEFERRSKALFDASVDNVDMRIRSRLTQARHAALEAAAPHRSARSRWLFLGPAFGAAAALVLGVALWVGHSTSDGLTAMSDSRPGIEDLDLVASNDQMELLQDDIEFYDWVDKAPASDKAGSG
jgi:hypothetical protein